MTQRVRPLILSGGSGTRLWPLSTESLPKQFVDLVGSSLFHQTIRRLGSIDGLTDPVVVTGAAHLDVVRLGLADAGFPRARIVTEPVGRNTAPAILAAAHLSEPDDVLVVLPSDHLVSDVEGFRAAATEGIRLARQGYLVTFGVQPDRPATGYGYIKVGMPMDGAFSIERFKEKPDQAEAVRLVGDGSHLWNSGMFVFSASTILDEAETAVPQLSADVAASLPGVRDEVIELDPSFADVQSISIDHAVMEHTSRGVVVPIDVGWNDVGSFRALWGASSPDERGNVVHGDAVLQNVTDSYIYASNRPLVVAEVDGIVVVDSAEGVLVVSKDSSQVVGELARGLDTDKSR